MAAQSTVKVTVFIPVYNGAQFLAETIDSVLAQTYSDFELLVVDDCSTDRSVEIVRAYADPRIRLECNERNRGRPYTRNRGLELARGEYLAVLDADDVCEPERLAQSVAFLDANPDVAAVGSAATYMDEGGRPLFIERVPTDSEAIRARIFATNCFVHSSVTYRRALVLAIGGYDERLPVAQDYDLFLRLSVEHQLANLAEPLVRYRIHGGQVSQAKLATQRRLADAARVAAFDALRRRGGAGSAVEAPDVSMRGKLLGRRGTLGADCLQWARIYREMGDRVEAARMVARAMFNAPFSARAWRAARWALPALVLPERARRALRWYSHKALSRFRAN